MFLRVFKVTLSFLAATRETKNFRINKLFFLFSIYFRSFVVKELTPEELEKTERFAKACSDILKSEKSEEEKLSFGVALDKRNASVSASLYRTKKLSDR